MPDLPQARPIVVLIPALKPDDKLIALCRALRGYDIPILIVDDGSGADYLPFFEQAQAAGAIIARHAVNMGKGRAIKTGINIIMQRWPNVLGIITADSDGQHVPEDIGRMMAAMREHPDALILGVRSFNNKMPARSRIGNTATRIVYQLLSGLRCSDTQTGLRGLPAASLPAMLHIPGERYEYEMDMLLRVRDMNLVLHEVPIQTIYFNKNRGSHFTSVRDAVRVFLVIVRHMLLSILIYCLDYGIFLACMNDGAGLQAWIAYVIGRCVGRLVYLGATHASFYARYGGTSAFLRYLLVVFIQLIIGTGLIWAFTSPLELPAMFMKAPIDAALFLIAYFLQRKFVTTGKIANKKQKKPSGA